jgi:hypothetical protein
VRNNSRFSYVCKMFRFHIHIRKPVRSLLAVCYCEDRLVVVREIRLLAILGHHNLSFVNLCQKLEDTILSYPTSYLSLGHSEQSKQRLVNIFNKVLRSVQNDKNLQEAYVNLHDAL